MRKLFEFIPYGEFDTVDEYQIVRFIYDNVITFGTLDKAVDADVLLTTWQTFCKFNKIDDWRNTDSLPDDTFIKFSIYLSKIDVPDRYNPPEISI